MLTFSTIMEWADVKLKSVCSSPLGDHSFFQILTQHHSNTETGDKNRPCELLLKPGFHMVVKRVVTIVEIDCKPISTTVTRRLRPYGNLA